MIQAVTDPEPGIPVLADNVGHPDVDVGPFREPRVAVDQLQRLSRLGALRRVLEQDAVAHRQVGRGDGSIHQLEHELSSLLGAPAPSGARQTPRH